MITIKEMQQSFDTIKEIRPSYKSILDFYTRVFTAQEKSRQDISLEPMVIEPSLLNIKLKNQLPLIDQSEFSIDKKTAKALFERLCDIALHAPNLSSSAKILKQATLKKVLNLDELFKAILNNQSTLHNLSELLGVREREIYFFAYASIAPGISICAEQLANYLTDMTDMEKGYCPICGNHPDLAYLDKDGKRHLKCCFCNHEWKVKRMGCIFCEDNEKQHYFFSEEEKEYRVDLCDNCHNYIKMVDLRQIQRAFYPKLEQITTLHLDIKAKEKGYTNGTLANDVSL